MEEEMNQQKDCDCTEEGCECEDMSYEEVAEHSNDKVDAKTKPEPEVETTTAQNKDSQGFPELFGNVDEIKKAVIYREILNRKY